MIFNVKDIRRKMRKKYSGWNPKASRLEDTLT